MTLSLLGLPPDVLEKILRIAGTKDPATLFNCERTCRALRSFLEVHDKEIWPSVEPVLPEYAADDRFRSDRERIFSQRVLCSMRHEVKKSENILVTELGTMEDIRRFLLSIVFEEQLTPSTECHRPVSVALRGDTLATVVDVVEASMIDILQRAITILLSSHTDSESYPAFLTAKTLNAYFRACFPAFLGPRVLPGERNNSVGRAQVEQQTRDRIIRRLCHRAGVPRMSSDAYDAAWHILVDIVDRVLFPPIRSIRLVSEGRAPPRLEPYSTKLQAGETIHDVPPIPFFCCPGCLQMAMIITPVPKQVQDIATSLGLPGKLYSDEWLVDATDEMMQEVADEEVAMAELEYDLYGSDDESIDDSESDIMDEIPDDFDVEGMDRNRPWVRTEDGGVELFFPSETGPRGS